MYFSLLKEKNNEKGENKTSYDDDDDIILKALHNKYKPPNDKFK